MEDHEQQPGADPQRDPWRKARSHINEYENTLRELEFDLRREQDRLKAVQDQQAQLKRANETADKKKLSHQSKCNELNTELVRLHQESWRLAQEAPQYAQQLTLVDADLAKLKDQLAGEREGMQQHLTEQDEVTADYKDFTATRGRPAPEDDAAASR